MSDFDYNADGHMSLVEAAFATGLIEDADRNGEWEDALASRDYGKTDWAGAWGCCLKGFAIIAVWTLLDHALRWLI